MKRVEHVRQSELRDIASLPHIGKKRLKLLLDNEYDCIVTISMASIEDLNTMLKCGHNQALTIKVEAMIIWGTLSLRYETQRLLSENAQLKKVMEHFLVQMESQNEINDKQYKINSSVTKNQQQITQAMANLAGFSTFEEYQKHKEEKPESLMFG